MGYWRDKARILAKQHEGVRPSWVSEEIEYYERLAAECTSGQYKLKGCSAKTYFFRGKADEDQIIKLLGVLMEDLEEFTLEYREDEDAETTRV